MKVHRLSFPYAWPSATPIFVYLSVKNCGMDWKHGWFNHLPSEMNSKEPVNLDSVTFVLQNIMKSTKLLSQFTCPSGRPEPVTGRGRSAPGARSGRRICLRRASLSGAGCRASLSRWTCPGVRENIWEEVKFEKCQLYAFTRVNIGICIMFNVNPDLS